MSQKYQQNLSCKCKCKFYCGKCNLNQKKNNSKYRCECKNPTVNNTCEEDYIWNHTICSCENCEYLASSINDSVITWDGIVNDADNVSTKFTYKCYEYCVNKFS